MVFRVDISDLLIDIGKLVGLPVELIIIYNLVDLLYPVIIHEHLVVARRSLFFFRNKLLILWLSPESIGLNLILLVKRSQLYFWVKLF